MVQEMCDQKPTEASLVYHMKRENKNNKVKDTKNKNQICSEEMLNGQESLKSVLREGGTEGLREKDL